MKPRWWWLAGAVVLAGGLLFAARNRGPAKQAQPPFRLGRVQSAELQVSVREVGVVDPLTRVDIKAPVSGRVVAIKVREGDPVRRGQMLAEVEPDVTQAQQLSAVQGRVSKARLEFNQAEREFNQQAALYRQGPLGFSIDRIGSLARRLVAAPSWRRLKTGLAPHLPVRLTPFLANL